MYHKLIDYLKITTFIDGVFCFFSLLGMLPGIIWFLFGDAYGLTSTIFNNAANHELTGGYEIIGGLFIMIFETMAYVLFIALTIICAILFVIFLICTLVGIVTYQKSKDGKFYYTVDAIFKLIIHFLIFVVILIYSLYNKVYLCLFLGIPALVMAVICVFYLIEIDRFKNTIRN